MCSALHGALCRAQEEHGDHSCFLDRLMPTRAASSSPAPALMYLSLVVYEVQCTNQCLVCLTLRCCLCAVYSGLLYCYCCFPTYRNLVFNSLQRLYYMPCAALGVQPEGSGLSAAGAAGHPAGCLPTHLQGAEHIINTLCFIHRNSCPAAYPPQCC